MNLTKDQSLKLKNVNKTSWKTQIVAHLKAHNGITDLQLYDATRPDRLNISDTKKRHNLASQFTYLRDDNYIIQKDQEHVFLLAEPNPTDKNTLTVITGQEDRVKAML